MKVRALGKPYEWVGYYDHLRRRGGDVFILKPITTIKKNKETGEVRKITIAPEQQFSKRWMEKVDDTAPLTKPASSKDLGKADARAQRAQNEEVI
jgi:hypothetical protein